MVQKAKRIVLGENTLISVGFLFVLGAPIMGGVVWATNLTNKVGFSATAIEKNTTAIEKLEVERSRCLIEIKQTVSTLQSEVLKLRSEFVQRENREQRAREARQ